MLVEWPRENVSQDNKRESGALVPLVSTPRSAVSAADFVTFEPVTGGVTKRAIELSLTIITAPVWLALIAGFVFRAKRRGVVQVIEREPCVGYGGAAFKRYRMRLEPPSAEIVPLRADVASEPLPVSGISGKWRTLAEALPGLINVLRGEMSLVGPRPRNKDAVDRLGAGKKFYMSARPGLLALTPEAESDEQDVSVCKLYNRLWMVETDTALVRDAWRAWRKRAG